MVARLGLVRHSLFACMRELGSRCTVRSVLGRVSKVRVRVTDGRVRANQVVCMERPIEECVICTEDLGVPERPAAQLPCGHAFCHECCDEWIRNQQKAGCGVCPSCRITFKPSKLRPLLPWKGGLTLKETSSAEYNAIRELEGVRSARMALEKRAAAAERAVEFAKRKCLAAERAAAAAEQRAAAAPSDGTVHPVPPSATQAAAPSASTTLVTATTAEAAPCSETCAITEAQRQRAAEKKAAALALLERKRAEQEAQRLLAASRASEAGLAQQFPDIRET